MRDKANIVLTFNPEQVQKVQEVQKFKVFLNILNF